MSGRGGVSWCNRKLLIIMSKKYKLALVLAIGWLGLVWALEEPLRDEDYLWAFGPLFIVAGYGFIVGAKGMQ
jgi:hypothetical protein